MKVGHDVVNTVGQGDDWTGGKASALMMNALPSDAILLVVNSESGACGLQELVEWGSVWDDMLISPEGHTFDLKLLGPSALLATVPSVFTNSQQVVECYIAEEAHCLGFGIVVGEQGLAVEQVGDAHWDSKLSPGGRILPAEALYLLGEALPVGSVLGVGVVGGVGFSIQFEGRADGSKRDLNRRSADATASSESSSTHF